MLRLLPEILAILSFSSFFWSSPPLPSPHERKLSYTGFGGSGGGGGGGGVVAFSSRAKILRECSPVNSPPEFFFFFNGD